MLLAVSEAANRECACVPNIAAGFQGGLMAGEICGAVAGGALAIGLIYGEDAELVGHLTEVYLRRFKGQNEKVRCMDIIGFNVGSANTGLEISSTKDFLIFLARGGKRGCKEVVTLAVETLLDVVNEWES